MRTSIPGYNVLADPLMRILELVYKKADGRTKRRAAKIQLSEVGWSELENDSINKLKKALEELVLLSHPDPKKQLYVCSDASDRFWGAVITQTSMLIKS